MSFREKSQWVTFVTLLVAFGFYFARALPGATADVQPRQMALFVVAVMLLVVTQIAGHVIVAIADRRPAPDERDRAIELRGTRNGAFVLATGVLLALWTAVGTEGNFAFTHVLLGSWVVSQLVDTGSQLVLHRRGG